MRLVRAMAGVVMVLGLCGAALNAQTTKKTAKPTKVGPEAAYCTATGGLVEVRYAVYGTNNSQQNWLPLAGVEPFCQYTLAADGSRIHLSLDTLFTTKPTLAALAYYAQVPWNGQGNGNPRRTIARNWEARRLGPPIWLAAAGSRPAVLTRFLRPACFRTIRPSIRGDCFITRTALFAGLICQRC